MNITSTARGTRGHRESKLTQAQYRFACELIWGGVPVDRTQAEESALFKERAPGILERYPMLDRSFFEEYEKTSRH